MKAATTFLTRKELARELRVSEGTVSALCRRGMPCVLIGRTQSRTKGCRPRFLVADVTAWLKRNSNYDVEL